MPLIHYAQFQPSLEFYIRVTEIEDTRITETSDTRITNDATGNTVYGTLVADATLISFSSEPYVNDNGTWKLYTPYVKTSGVWKQPTRIYKKVSGNWKRVY
jgi:hypothetical protein